jgi:hypothetical protein
MDACLALLLLCAPGLRSLHLGEGFDNDNRILNRMFRSVTSGLPQKKCMPAAKGLRDINLAHCRFKHDELGVFPHGSKSENTVDVLSFFYLPRIQSITACIEKPTSFSFKWPSPDPPHARTLKSLHLTVIGDGYLNEILAVTPNLENFRWNWIDHPETPGTSETIKFVMDLAQMANDLSHVRNSLTDLNMSVHISRRQYAGLVPVEIRGPFTTFCGLDRVRRLEAPLPFLVGFAPPCCPMPHLEAALPSSIEHLVITDDLFLQDN